MATINLEMIDKINAQLDGLTTFVDNELLWIQEEINSAGDRAQEVANEKMAELSAKMTAKLEIIRQKIIDIFSAQYQAAMEKIAPIKSLLDMLPISFDPTVVVKALTMIIDIITAPYQPVIEFITTVIPKVLELSANLEKIANYQPTLPTIPNVTIPPLNIEIEPITPGDITGK